MTEGGKFPFKHKILDSVFAFRILWFVRLELRRPFRVGLN